MSLWRISDEILDIDRRLEESGGEITPEIEAALDAVHAALPAKISSIAGYLRYLSVIQATAKAEEERIRDIRKAAENREGRIRDYLAACMERMGYQTIQADPLAGVASVRLQKGRTKVVIDDPEKLPNDMVNVVFTRKPKTDDIKAMLEIGCEVPGARLEQGRPFVVIK
jgi:hypothetical protein